MKGLEGLKILIESEEIILPAWAEIGSIIGIILGIVFLITFIFSCIDTRPDYKAICLTGLIICTIWTYKSYAYDNTFKKIYKTTAIESKYYIDLSMYEVIDTEGEIITLRSKNTYTRD